MRLQAETAQFTGTENWYQHSFKKNFIYTDGIKFVAEKYGAYWLIDAIASYQPVKGEGLADFQLWDLTVTGNTAILTCRSDSDKPAVITQKIEYTDFPESIKLYVEGGTLLLPSEH